MKLLIYCILLTLTITSLPWAKGEKILFFTPMGSKSHKIFFMGITEALAKRGHQVTMVSPYEPFEKINNVREVILKNFSIDAYLEKVFEERSIIPPLIRDSHKICVQLLGQKDVQDLKKENFDLIIISAFFDYCFLSFVHHFKVPFVYAYSSILLGPYHEMIGSLDFPAISGNVFLEPGFPLTFRQRLQTTLLNSVFYVMFKYYVTPRIYSECVTSGLCPTDMPQFSEISKNASLMIVNSVRTLDWPQKPGMPNVIYAGGAHIKAPKKLPKDLEDWVKGSGEEGFIFFSMGSALNPDIFPEKYRQILVKVFGSLKQRVLWKWNQETMEDLPKNVKLQKWLPQSDLLGHPKIKLFITHGGQLSTLEASYHGVPVIGLPVFADQHSNMRIVESEGWGKYMELVKLEENVFRGLVEEMLNNKTISEIAKSKSALMQDRLIPPDEEAAYWVEYVMRHKGAPHIRSPVNSMSWREIYNMDVWFFIFSVITAVFYVSWLIFRFVLKKCFGIGRSEANKRKTE